MESDGDKNLESNFKRKPGNAMPDASDVLQPVWLRHNPVLAYRKFRQHLESQFRIVLYCGVILWGLYTITH